MNAPLYAWTGDTFLADFTVTEDGAPVDLTGATFELLVARTPGGTGFTYAGASFFDVDAVAGKFSVTVTSDETALWTPAGRWEYQVRVKWPAGAEQTLAAGPLLVSARKQP